MIKSDGLRGTSEGTAELLEGTRDQVDRIGGRVGIDALAWSMEVGWKGDVWVVGSGWMMAIGLTRGGLRAEWRMGEQGRVVGSGGMWILGCGWRGGWRMRLLIW